MGPGTQLDNAMNVGSKDDKIAAVARGNLKSKEVIDATAEIFHFITAQTATFLPLKLPLSGVLRSEIKSIFVIKNKVYESERRKK